jgi:hypothetical protein
VTPVPHLHAVLPTPAIPPVRSVAGGETNEFNFWARNVSMPGTFLYCGISIAVSTSRCGRDNPVSNTGYRRPNRPAFLHFFYSNMRPQFRGRRFGDVVSSSKNMRSQEAAETNECTHGVPRALEAAVDEPKKHCRNQKP